MLRYSQKLQSEQGQVILISSRKREGDSLCTHVLDPILYIYWAPLRRNKKTAHRWFNNHDGQDKVDTEDDAASQLKYIAPRVSWGLPEVHDAIPQKRIDNLRLTR